MLKIPLMSVLSAGISAVVLMVGAAILPTFTTTSTAQSQPAAPQIVRNTMLDTTVEVEAGLYHMTVAELNLDPRAETPVHIHPGPSVGYVESGRLQITLAESGEVATYSSGSAFDHPWDRPHVMSNNSDVPSKMLSFELNPIAR
jgi:quercetin dioxygenase-like cupin family protein